MATSGDTGKADMEGFADVPQTRIQVYYPKNGVSAVQEQQMVTQEGENVDVRAVIGNFDDAQSGVKRIFPDEAGKLNRSAVELGYSVLVVSNFTLYGDTSRGKRPSFIHAAKGETAKSAYDAFLQELMNAQGLKDVQHGEFGADMQVSLVNDGPVTIIIDTDEWK